MNAELHYFTQNHSDLWENLQITAIIGEPIYANSLLEK